MESDSLAKTFGYISIFCWIVVFTPQFRENYVRKNTDGVSISFLALWIVGDVLNLFGIILENLLFTMLLLALYYLFADCVLMGQVFYYRTYYPKQHYEEVVSTMEEEQFFSESSSLLSSTMTTVTNKSNRQKKKQQEQSVSTKTIVKLFFVSSILIWLGLLAGSCLFFFGPGKREKVDMSQWHILPQLLGWGSAILYCASRIPQIMQNFRNESVEGLSLIMFVFSVVGNVTYCVSIILESTDPTYLLINYPWLLGSGGTLFFDFTIFFQFYMYRSSKRTYFEF